MVSSGVKAAAATLNVSIDKLEANSASPQNGVREEQTNGVARHKRSEDHQQQSKFIHQQSSHQQSSHQQEAIINRQEESSPTQTSVVKHSLLQFALQHFRYE